jgi:3-dehydroquinate synthase class II
MFIKFTFPHIEHVLIVNVNTIRRVDPLAGTTTSRVELDNGDDLIVQGTLEEIHRSLENAATLHALTRQY